MHAVYIGCVAIHLNVADLPTSLSDCSFVNSYEMLIASQLMVRLHIHHAGILSGRSWHIFSAFVTITMSS